MACMPGCFPLDPNWQVGCLIPCPDNCTIYIDDAPKHKNWTQHPFRSIVPIVSGSLLGVFFVCLLFMICRRFRKMRANQRIDRGATSPSFVSGGEFVDDVHMVEIDHPIWHIRTVGLQESLIEAIPLFKYKKEEGVIDSTVCAVCLNEFEEEEYLRRLPKCSHAFHLSCIDTWLRSHQNCPVCRAPVAAPASDSSSPTATNLSAEESHTINIGSNSGSTSEEEASEANESNGSATETVMQNEVLSSSSDQDVCDGSNQGALDKSKEVSKQGSAKGKVRENRRISDSLSFRNLQIRPTSVVRSFSSSGKLCASSGV